MAETTAHDMPPPHVRLIYIAAKLGLADYLADGPKAAGKLAHLTGAPLTSLNHVLVALTGLGVLTEDGNHRFALTPLGAALKMGESDSEQVAALLRARNRLAARRTVVSRPMSEISAQPDLSPELSAALEPPLEFIGAKLSADEDVLIQGSVERAIRHPAHDVTIGERGRVKATVEARTITVFGTVEGDLRGAEAVYLASTGRITGNIFAPRVTMADGARVSGTVHTTRAMPADAPRDASKENRSAAALAGSLGVRARRQQPKWGQ